VDVDGRSVRSWQDLRWRLLEASGHADAVLTVEQRDGSTATRVVSLATLPPAEWEGNFMPTLGLKADFGPPVVEQVIPGKPAERAGLKAGDRIIAIAGTIASSPADVASRTNAKPGAAVTYRIARGGETFDTTLTTEVTEQAGRRIGIAGVRLKGDPDGAQSLTVTLRYGVIDALGQGAKRTWELSLFTLKMLGRILTGDASLKNISGPITMADYAGQSAQAGVLVFLGYLALISISLGVLNLLP